MAPEPDPRPDAAPDTGPAVGPVTLRDGRLALRLLTDDDVPVLTRACQDPDMHRWLTRLPDPYREDDARAFVAQTAASWQAGTELTFAITDAADGRLLGVCSLFDLKDVGHPAGASAELGYWVAAWERGRGVMTAAARLLCAWAFDELGVRRLEWQAEVGNQASRRVAEKVGFTVEGVCRQRLVHLADSRRADSWLGSLLPGELR
jgi:RimJ/RimL family protein N-acetyltransferase